jgi:phosphatidylserine/phosphatidylglycerophosphate/cardiolipin synthase-like enzyme
MSLRHSIAALIGGTKRSLDIASPFLDVQGVSALEDNFRIAARSAVTLRLIARIEDPENPDPRLIQGLLRLMQIFGPSTQVRNLAYLSQNPFTGRANITCALHAKFLVSDRAAAYVGSADLRYTGLFANFEVGLVLRDQEQVNVLEDLFTTAWSTSEPLSRDYVERKAGL